MVDYELWFEKNRWILIDLTKNQILMITKSKRVASRALKRLKSGEKW